MIESFEEAARIILNRFRHLMTEAERRADRALVFRAKLVELESRSGDAAAEADELRRQIDLALSDAIAEELSSRGRGHFDRSVVRRIVAEHPDELPRCAACGEFFKSPSPKRCFTCDFLTEAPPAPPDHS